MEETKVAYVELNQSNLKHNESSSWNTPGSDLDIVYDVPSKNIDKKIWRMQAAGGYLRNAYILAITIISHLLNIIFAVWTFWSDGDGIWSKCVEFEITILIIQCEAFLLYCLAFYCFDSHDKMIKNSNPGHVQGNIIKTRHKPMSKIATILIIILIVVSYGSSIAIWITNYNAYTNRIRQWIQAILYCFDIYKWFQIITVIYILHGVLNTFPKKLTDFKQDIQISMKMRKRGHSITNNSNYPLNDSINSSYNYNNIKLDEYECLDTAQFKRKYKKTVEKYRDIVVSFRAFIVMFCICNILMWASLIATICIALSNKGTYLSQECVAKELNLFFMHYMSEIILYFLLWMILLWKLHRNHSETQSYHSDFVSHSDGASDKLHAINYFLSNEIESRSPFAIIGQINPTARRVFFLFFSVFGPLTFYTIKFLLF